MMKMEEIDCELLLKALYEDPTKGPWLKLSLRLEKRP